MRQWITIALLTLSVTLMAQLTDYHAHAIPESYRQLVAKHDMLLDEGFPLPQWSAEAHLKMMEDAGITSSVLTLPAPHPYFGEIDFDANIRCLWFDLAGSPSEETINALLTITSPDRLLYGSDYPYVAPQVIKANIERMKKHLTNDNASSLTREANLQDGNGMTDRLIVRIAEIEVYKKYLNDYIAAAHNVGTKSVETEPGVVCIFPMQVKDKPNTIRIVEIYRNQEAYQSHLKTPHFLEYKQTTLHMVRRLQLVDTFPLAPEAMPLIFKKL